MFRLEMDSIVRCVLLAQLTIITLSTTTNANPSGEKKSWLQSSSIGSLLKTSGKCKFSMQFRNELSNRMQQIEMNSDELNSLVIPNTTNDALHLPHQLISFFHSGLPECPTRIIIDENANYKLEKFSLTNLPQLPGNIHRLRALKTFECDKIYSKHIDIAILNNMVLLKTISLHRSNGVTISHSMHLPSLQKLNIEICPMLLFNNVVCDFPKLTDLRLHNNSLEEIPSFFYTLKKLTRIELARNQLQRLTFDVFNNMTELVFLILVRNQISEITTETPVELPRLHSLDLDYNNLAVLNVTLWITPALTVLKLSYNRLKQVPSLLTLFRGNVIKLEVDDNPWDCGWLNQTIESIPNAQVAASRSKDFCGVKEIKTKNRQG